MKDECETYKSWSLIINKLEMHWLQVSSDSDFFEKSDWLSRNSNRQQNSRKTFFTTNPENNLYSPRLCVKYFKCYPFTLLLSSIVVICHINKKKYSEIKDCIQLFALNKNFKISSLVLHYLL